MTNTLILAFLVLIGQFVQTVTGFGSNVLILSAGALVYPFEKLVVVLVMLSWLQVSWLTLRNHEHIQWGLLLKRIFPAVFVGLPIGMWIYYHFNVGVLKIILGIFIVSTSAVEIYRLFGKNIQFAPLSDLVGYIVLFSAGLVHGMFASSGPLIAYFSSRQINHKGQFRATLAMLWFTIDGILIVSFLRAGRITTASLTMAGYLLPALIIGIICGEIMHHRVNELTFKKIVQIMLLLAGLSLFV